MADEKDSSLWVVYADKSATDMEREKTDIIYAICSSEAIAEQMKDKCENEKNINSIDVYTLPLYSCVYIKEVVIDQPL